MNKKQNTQESIKETISKNKIGLYINEQTKANIAEQLRSQVEEENTNKIFTSLVEKNIGSPHLIDYPTVDGVMTKFGLTNAIVNKYIDFIIGPGLFVEAEDENAQTKLDKFLKETQFCKYLSPWLQEAFAKGDGYMELAGLDDPKKQVQLKVISTNSMYKVRDKYGTIIRYNQYIGNSKTRINPEEVIPFKPTEIANFSVNMIGDKPYGYGLIYPALTTINEFLMAQKAIHKLTKRKANSPIHVQMGNVEKDDYPAQADIDAFGSKLQYMDEVTEWVTGPNVEMKVLDFGNIGEKFAEILNNDYKLLSYSFQVPEVLLGAGNVAEGLAKVQMDAFERRIKNYQNELGYIIKDILKRVLKSGGLATEFEIKWGQPSEEDTKLQIQLLLQVAASSPGMRQQCEEQIADLLGFDYNKIQVQNEIETKKQDAINGLEVTNKNGANVAVKKMAMDKEEKKPLVKIPENKMKGLYQEKCGCNKCIKEDVKDYTLKEWVNINIEDYNTYILAAIAKDGFTDIAAANAIEKAAGYLSPKELARFKLALSEAFAGNKSIRELERTLEDRKIIKPLYDYNENGVIKDANGNKVMLMDAASRAHIIARTESNRMANLGAIDNFKELGVQEVRWMAGNDDRTCEECSELNGTVYSINESIDIPVHPFCRCTTSPIVKGLTEA